MADKAGALEDPAHTPAAEVTVVALPATVVFFMPTVTKVADAVVNLVRLLQPVVNPLVSYARRLLGFIEPSGVPPSEMPHDSGLKAAPQNGDGAMLVYSSSGERRLLVCLLVVKMIRK